VNKISLDIKTDQIEIRHKGLYDLDTIYKKIRAWYNEREYYYDEPKYKDKISDFGNELEIKMTGFLPVTDFVSYTVKVEGKFYRLKEFETEYKGEKRKMNKGQFFLQFKGNVSYDYQDRFKSKLAKFLLDFMINTIFKKYYEIKYLDKLYYEIYTLQTLIKELTYMETASNAY